MSKKQAPAKAQEKKPVISSELSAKAWNLREEFVALPEQQQQLCTQYFNLYNATAFTFNELLSQAAQNYINHQIAYSRELMLLEQKQVPADVEIDEASNFDENGNPILTHEA